MRFTYTENISSAKWESMIQSSDCSYFFHTPSWAKILEESFQYRISPRLYEVNDAEIFIPMMKKSRYGFTFYHSMPEGYGGVFSTQPISNDLIQKILVDTVGGKTLFLSIKFPPMTNITLSENSYISELKSSWSTTHVLECTAGYEKVAQKFNRSFKRSLKHAREYNIDLFHEQTLENYRDYYDLYVERSKEWGYSSPHYLWNLFKNIYDYGRPYVTLHLARKGDETLAGIIAFEYNHTIFIWSTISTEKTRVYKATHLLLDEFIKSGCGRNIKCINFGASGDIGGVKQFKDGVGADVFTTPSYLITSSLGKILNLFSFLKRRT